MKLGPPPPPPSPPVGAAMQMVALLATCTSEADRPARPLDGTPDAAQKVHPHGHSPGHPHFKCVHAGKALTAQSGGRPHRAALKRRRKAGKSATGAVEHCEFDEWNLEEISDDYEVRRHKSAFALRTHSSQRDDAERGNRDEGHRLERHIVAIRNALGEMQGSEAATHCTGNRLAALEGALGSRFPLHAMAFLMASQARVGAASGAPTGLPAMALLAARSWLGRQGFGLSGGSATLSEIRAVLMAARPPATPTEPRRAAACNVWLPVFLLNLDRPRTASQRYDAMERARMLERMASPRGNA